MTKLLCPECNGSGVIPDSITNAKVCPTCNEKGVVVGQPDRKCKHLNGQLFAIEYNAKEVMYCMADGELEKIIVVDKMNPTMRLLPKFMFRCSDCRREFTYRQYRDDHPKWLKERLAVCVKEIERENLNDVEYVNKRLEEAAKLRGEVKTLKEQMGELEEYRDSEPAKLLDKIKYLENTISSIRRIAG